MDLPQITLFVLIGFAGGAWNAVAGGASLFTFPALIAAGLPPVVANATNFLALLPSNAAALPTYRAELRAIGQALVPLLVVSGLGAIMGSALLLVSDPDLFVALIPALILAATALFAFGERMRTWLLARLDEGASRRVIYGALFVASIYGGYFGAGLGIVLLGVAQVLGYADFDRANAIKNLLATSFTVLSIAVFGLGGLIAWNAAVVMMVGSTAGGYVGGRLAKRAPTTLLRYVVIVFGVVLTALYLVRGVG